MLYITENRKVRFDYEIKDTYKAGIVLFGFEVKAIHQGKAHLAGSFVIIRGGELFWINGNIAPYQPSNTPPSYQPDRIRKLLMKHQEIEHIVRATQQKGLTLIPLGLYNEGRKIKIAFGLVRKKKKYEKKEAIERRESEREQREFV